MNRDPDDTTAALLLFSGGQDSATCLSWALSRFARVETVGFDYGQRHAVELEVRESYFRRFRERFPEQAARLGPDTVLDAGVLGGIGETAMTENVAIALREDGLPNTFVPGRNLLFLVLAGALAVRRGAGTLVGGMCETDFSGYPDCRREAIDAQERALALGLGTPMRVVTPLMHLTKADSWALAQGLGGDALVELIRTETHTCYLGVRDTLHEWGYGCGECPACELRAAGWRDWTARGRPSLGGAGAGAAS